jgi:hypothetical protein
MTTAEKQKAIAVAFSDFRYGYYPTGREPEYLYDDWLLTEEGKRLTAEDRSEPEEPIVNILINISKKIDRIEGRMDKMNGNLFAE